MPEKLSLASFLDHLELTRNLYALGVISKEERNEVFVYLSQKLNKEKDS